MKGSSLRRRRAALPRPTCRRRQRPPLTSSSTASAARARGQVARWLFAVGVAVVRRHRRRRRRRSPSPSRVSGHDGTIAGRWRCGTAAVSALPPLNSAVVSRGGAAVSAGHSSALRRSSEALSDSNCRVEFNHFLSEFALARAYAGALAARSGPSEKAPVRRLRPNGETSLGRSWPRPHQATQRQAQCEAIWNQCIEQPSGSSGTCPPSSVPAGACC